MLLWWRSMQLIGSFYPVSVNQEEKLLFLQVSSSFYIFKNYSGFPSELFDH